MAGADSLVLVPRVVLTNVEWSGVSTSIDHILSINTGTTSGVVRTSSWWFGVSD